MNDKPINVEPHPEGGWQTKRDGGQRASHRTETKAEAEQRGREIARNQGIELVVKGKNGEIQRKDSHGRDPNPPRG